ncbi:MAG: hypothetical protein LBD03_02995 [Methanobrevibacter sp.]|nr:hypothetical protein [Candidatus Methanovirga procula]
MINELAEIKNILKKLVEIKDNELSVLEMVAAIYMEKNSHVMEAIQN